MLCLCVCVSRTLFRVSLVLVVRRMLCSVRDYIRVYAATHHCDDVLLPDVSKPLVEVLFLAVQEFNFLVYPEPDGIDCSPLVL